MTPEPAYFNISRAAAYLGKDRAYVRQLIRHGYLTLYHLPLAKWPVLKREDLDKLALPANLMLKVAK